MRDLQPEEIGHVYGAGGCGYDRGKKHDHHGTSSKKHGHHGTSSKKHHRHGTSSKKRRDAAA